MGIETYKDNKGEYRFRVKARNGEIIASGEGYTTSQGRMNGIESLIKNLKDFKVKDIKEV